MRKLVLIATTMLTSGCAQYAWVSPGKSQSDFNMQLGICRNEALRVISPPAPSAPPPPIIQAPTTTDCQRDMFGNFQCTTQPNHSANLYGGIVASNNDMWARNRYNTQLNQYVENCLQSNGWMLQKIKTESNSATSATQPNESTPTKPIRSSGVFIETEDGKPWSINTTKNLPNGFGRSPSEIKIDEGSIGVLTTTNVLNDGLECLYKDRQGHMFSRFSNTSCPTQAK